MLTATEFFELTPLLSTVLWIEAVIYLGIGIYEIFDDFIAKAPRWAEQENSTNAWILLQHVIGHKMHAAICTILGFVALNGALEGQVTRFELELIFVSFAVIMPVIWSTMMPGRLGIMIVLLKPEFWLQIVMFVFFGHLVRPEILLLCIALNLWGMFVNFKHVRNTYFQPYTYEEFRKHVVAAVDEQYATRIDKLAGYQVDTNLNQAPEVEHSEP